MVCASAVSLGLNVRQVINTSMRLIATITAIAVKMFVQASKVIGVSVKMTFAGVLRRKNDNPPIKTISNNGKWRRA